MLANQQRSVLVLSLAPKHKPPLRLQPVVAVGEGERGRVTADLMEISGAGGAEGREQSVPGPVPLALPCPAARCPSGWLFLPCASALNDLDRRGSERGARSRRQLGLLLRPRYSAQLSCPPVSRVATHDDDATIRSAGSACVLGSAAPGATANRRQQSVEGAWARCAGAVARPWDETTAWSVRDNGRPVRVPYSSPRSGGALSVRTERGLVLGLGPLQFLAVAARHRHLPRLANDLVIVSPRRLYKCDRTPGSYGVRAAGGPRDMEACEKGPRETGSINSRATTETHGGLHDGFFPTLSIPTPRHNSQTGAQREALRRHMLGQRGAAGHLLLAGTRDDGTIAQVLASRDDDPQRATRRGPLCSLHCRALCLQTT
nr:unnamed protein product [Digitaria exilis]